MAVVKYHYVLSQLLNITMMISFLKHIAQRLPSNGETDIDVNETSGEKKASLSKNTPQGFLPVEGTKSKGRDRKTWNKCVKVDMKRLVVVKN